MRHPFEKFIKVEYGSLILALIIGLYAIIQSVFALLILSMYLIAISLFCDGIVALSTRQHVWAGKQVTRAFIICLVATLIFFKL